MKPILPTVLLLVSSAALAQAPDIILYHANVYTADPANPTAEAVAIQGNRIVAVGSDDAIRPTAGPKTKTIDVHGRLVIPGINDAHTHLSAMPASWKIAGSGPDATSEGIRAAIGFAIDETPRDLWMTAVIGPRVLTDPTMTRAALDKIAPGRKILLQEFTGHGAILSSAALEAAGIHDSDEEPVGGWYERDSSGKLNGKIFEYANWDACRRIGMTTSDADAVQQFQEFGAEALHYGITSIQNMSFLTRGRFVQIAERAHFPIRVRVIRFGMTDARGRETAAADPSVRPGSSLITLSGTKWILDGTPIEQGAALRESYHEGTHDVGRLDFNGDQMKAILDEAWTSKDQLLLHVAGDLTAQTVLKLMEAHPDWSGRRVRFEHGDGLLPDLREQAHALGIVVVQNPAHFQALHDYPSNDFFPLKSLMAANIPLALGSDGATNPFVNIVDAANHTRESESITREQALDAYTRGSAFAENAETQKGMIAKGMLADIAVLSQDIFHAHGNTLGDTRSVLTIVDGRIAWQSMEMQ